MVKRRFAGKVEVADDSSSQCGQRCCCDQDFLFHLHSSYNIVTVKGAAASRVFFHLKAEAVRMGE